VRKPRWLSKDEVIALHSRALVLYGGREGLRDPGLLESALARPLNVLAHESKANLHLLAATYAHGIASNHPFIDGKKRAAFYAAFAFLRINGRRLQAPEPEVVRMVEGLADKSVSPKRFATWLEAHSRRVKTR
jgi:death on curing protein